MQGNRGSTTALPYTPVPSASERRHVRSGLLLAVGGTGLFALKSIFIKLAYQQGVDTTTLLTLRMLLAAHFYAGMLWWLLQRSAGTRPTRTDVLAKFGLGFVGYYLA